MAISKWGLAGGLGLLLLIGLCSSREESGGASYSDWSLAATDTIKSANSTTLDAETPASGESGNDTLDAMEPVGGETYSEFDARRDALKGSAGTYEGDGCTVDCGGHEAGRNWAEQRGITDETECGGNSWSFREGCASFAREQSNDSSDEESDESDIDFGQRVIDVAEARAAMP